MRIGIFVETYLPYVSGLVTSIRMLEEGLKREGHSVFIFAANMTEKKTVKNDNVLYFKGTKVFLKNLSNYKIVFGLRRKIKIINEYNLDLIHIHSEFSIGKLGLLASKKLNIPLVYTFHTLYEEYLGYVSKTIAKIAPWLLMTLLRSAIKPIAKRAKITIVPTPKVLKHIHKYGVKNSIEIIPTGIDLARFKAPLNIYDEIALKEKFKINNEFIFMNIGRISEEKSLDKIVLAFSKIPKDFNAKLIFVGIGPYMEKLRKLINSNSLDNRVILAGEADWASIHKYYKLANVCINASSTETQGLTNIESLASGIPLLVQKDEAIADLIIDGVNGIIFDGTSELSEKMIFCYQNKEILNDFSKNCHKAVEKYSDLCYASNVLKVYEKIL